MFTKTLTELADFYGTDKGTVGPVPGWIGHNYTRIYEAYLRKRRLSALTILEIGLGVAGDRWNARIVCGRNTGGASLKMWYDYFPHARIYGLDLNPCPYLNNDRITTFVADQGNIQDLQAFINSIDEVEFDLIIDDGSHRPDHQQISLSFFFKRLKCGGLYFIEDLMSNGTGDGVHGSDACDTVLNTRRVLKHFQRYQEYPRPHALIDSSYLAQHMSQINFHGPERCVQNVFTRNFRRLIKTLARRRLDSETMCVIVKE